MTKTLYSGPPKKEAATYLAATDMPIYNLIDPDTLHVTSRTELLLTFGTSSSLKEKIVRHVVILKCLALFLLLNGIKKRSSSALNVPKFVRKWHKVSDFRERRKPSTGKKYQTC
jgi:hypothetical protein